MGEWLLEVLSCAVESLLWVGESVYKSVGGKGLSVFLTGISLLVVFLMVFGVLDLIRKLLTSLFQRGKEPQKADEKSKEPQRFIEKLMGLVNSLFKKFITLSKLSIAASVFLITVAWIVSIYLYDIGIPTVQEFQDKEFPVVSDKAQLPSPDSPTPESQAREALGQMGDFFGGMLNPILAFASFIALLYTIRIQSEELKLTREEFSKAAAAQVRLAGEAEQARKQNGLLEEYQYICSSIRTKIKVLDAMYNEPFSSTVIHSESGSGDIIVLKKIIDEACFKIRNLPDSLSDHEKFEEYKIYFNVVYGSPTDSRINEAFDNYCYFVLELRQFFETYIQLCTQLELGSGLTSVRWHDCNAVANHLFTAYLACELFQLYYFRNTFVPKESSEALQKFNEKIEKYGLSTV